ncbi:hypothetical protein, partial [Actinomadura roseirufa]|uniref:hypothetical protein n=1 Tax=Actinomadura roseirufa TaxID=2094049 RepID=UPI001A955450
MTPGVLVGAGVAVTVDSPPGPPVGPEVPGGADGLGTAVAVDGPAVGVGTGPPPGVTGEAGTA